MIIWILLLLSIITSVIIGIAQQNLLVCLLFYITFTMLSIAATLVLSVCLGRKDKFTLKNISSYEIELLNSAVIKLSTGEYINTKDIHNTIYCKDDIVPTLIIKQYNIGGWRRRWLLEMHNDKVEYIVYLPKYKTED